MPVLVDYKPALGVSSGTFPQRQEDGVDVLCSVAWGSAWETETGRKSKQGTRFPVGAPMEKAEVQPDADTGQSAL